MAVGTAQVASREEHRAGDPTGEVQQRKLPQPAYFHGDPLLSDAVNYPQYTMRYGRCQDKAQDIVAFSKKYPRISWERRGLATRQQKQGGRFTRLPC